MNLFSFSTAAACLLTFGFCLQTAQADTWTDSTGKHNIEAKFVQIVGDKVHLQKADGSVIAVPLNRLSAQSQQMAQRMAQKGDAPAAQMTAEQSVKALRDDFLAGEVQKMWEYLPENYQQDVNELIHNFASKMDPVVWKDIVDVIDTAVAVLKKQKKFILEQPQVAGGVKDEKGVDASYDELVGAMEIITTSSLMDLNKMKQMDMGVFLATTGKDFGKKMSSLSKLGDQVEAPAGAPGLPAGLPGAEVLIGKGTITTVEQGEETATLRFTTPGEEGEEDKVEDTVFVKYKGRWLPKEMVDDWDKNMKEAADGLDEMRKELPQVQATLAPAMKYLKKMEAAKTKEEFSAVIQEIVFAILAAQGGGFPGGGGNGGFPPGGLPGGGNGGFPPGGDNGDFPPEDGDFGT